MNRELQRQMVARLVRRALEVPETDEDLHAMADFLASQVDSMDDESVCFGAYVAAAVPGDRQHLITKLEAKLFLSYRARLIGWFEHALIRRANLGGGGKQIQQLEDGLAAWATAIPDLVATGRPFKLSDYLRSNDYFDEDMLDKVAQRVVRGVAEDARKAGVLGTGRTAKVPFEVRRDPQEGLWFIPSAMKTYDYREQIKHYGFRWNPVQKRWETRRITPDIRADFDVQRTPEAPPALAAPTVTPLLERLRDWYFGTWLPTNIDRISRVFTDYARSSQTSYKLFFKFTRNPSKPIEVKFDRDIRTPDEAVGELRYRYIGRQGREPWLEVLDRFVDLVGTTSLSRLPGLIDRINNLQHSNGLFMEHFPASVKAFYEPFLNAKYHTPQPDELAKFIPDRDLKKLLIEVARKDHRPFGWAFTPPPAYNKMVKELAAVGQQVNWREKGYPRYKGEKGLQPDRFDPAVRHGLDVLQKLHTQRENLLSTEPKSEAQFEKWVGDVAAWSQDYEQAREHAEKLMEAQRARELADPSHAADWEAQNFPEEFLEKFPWSVPGVSKSELAPFLARYASAKSASETNVVALLLSNYARHESGDRTATRHIQQTVEKLAPKFPDTETSFDFGASFQRRLAFHVTHKMGFGVVDVYYDVRAGRAQTHWLFDADKAAKFFGVTDFTPPDDDDVKRAFVSFLQKSVLI